jgi:hypothetical protein
MIKQLLQTIICKTKNHTLINAGECPYTRKTYNLCTRCGVMIEI